MDQSFDLNALNIRGINLYATKIRLILVTTHRRETFGKPIKNIYLALKEIAECYNRLLGNISNIALLPPLDYLSLVYFAFLMKRAYLVLNDLGGIQEEAPRLGKPVLVFREVIERPEAATAGTVRLVGTDCCRIITEMTRLLDEPSYYDYMPQAVNPYGDGRAAERMVTAILGKQIEPFVHNITKR